MKVAIAAVALLSGLLSACQRESANDGVAEQAAPASSKPAGLIVPGGLYKIDPTHALLQWSVPHAGLSNYTAKFTRYDSTITLDPTNIEASRIELSIDPTSVKTDYPADYKATHPNSRFATWDEEIGKSERFLNGAEFPGILFVSTKVERGPDATARVTGDLSFLGVTRPVTMQVTLNGQAASHPVVKLPALGLHAEGAFKRSDFGVPAGPMDTVKIVFDAEFHHVAASGS